MKQTSILALLVLAGAAAPFVGAAADAQGSTTTQIPDCVLQCRPWFIEQTTVDCETDCLAYEVEIEFNLAAGSGDPYIPRFSVPGCPGTVCPYGAETFTYQHGATVTVGAGLWSTSTGFWLGSGGGVVQADFFVAPVGAVIGVTDMDQLPWTALPTATFDPATGYWLTAWPTIGFDDPAGYFLRVDMLDSLLGPINAYTLATDLKGCGFHPYGEAIAATSALTLSGKGDACPGQTVQLTTDVQGSGATKVFTAISIAGDYLPLPFGPVLIGLVPPPTVLSAPVVGGQAQLNLPFPPNPLPPGARLYFQSLAFDPLTPFGIVVSNGLRLDPCPCP